MVHKKRRKPSQHVRRVKTKKGRKRVVVNKGIKKAPKIKRRMPTFRTGGHSYAETYPVMDQEKGKLGAVTKRSWLARTGPRKLKRLTTSDNFFDEMMEQIGKNKKTVSGKKFHDYITKQYGKDRMIDDVGYLQQWHLKNIDLIQDRPHWKGLIPIEPDDVVDVKTGVVRDAKGRIKRARPGSDPMYGGLNIFVITPNKPGKKHDKKKKKKAKDKKYPLTEEEWEDLGRRGFL